MGAAPNNNGGSRLPSALSEINVTPLVDVMLVLLIIFMITASMETVSAEQQMDRLRQEQLERLDELKSEDEKSDQQVPVHLPKVNSEKVNLTEEKKLVLTLNDELEFFLGSTSIVKCYELAPDLRAQLAAWSSAPPTGGTDAGTRDEIPPGLKKCLRAVEDKLIANKKLQEDGELYLRADRSLDYGTVLLVMARIRKAGVTKFGLVAEPELSAEDAAATPSKE